MCTQCTEDEQGSTVSKQHNLRDSQGTVFSFHASVFRQRLLISRVIFAMSNGMHVWWFLHWQCMPSLPCLCVSLVIPADFHPVQGYQVKQVQAFEVDTCALPPPSSLAHLMPTTLNDCHVCVCVCETIAQIALLHKVRDLCHTLYTKALVTTRLTCRPSAKN